MNALQAQVAEAETRLQKEAEELASLRAWEHALSPRRLSITARSYLTQYAQLVRRLGKGTGKYATERRAEVRQAMTRCRPAVPVWIMPIHRIGQQLTVQQNMFDGVIVDEASQAGLESTFLQYLAPRMVVIGDDKQVSPSAVGIDQQQLRDLGDQYISRDDPYRASWVDPKRSLFDEAVMRFGSRITLVEHRRCVPEIIGFSNRIAYEPDNVRLVPVRQYGLDRLRPIELRRVVDGYERGGSSNKINSAEAEALVDQIAECVVDPAYDNATFGVISLVGAAQARYIEALLMERIDPQEWQRRDLRCGDAAAFQGSERDVVFLSMVSSPEPGTRLGSLTQEMYLQRFNVAVSRAKDQFWLFHSIGVDDIGNSQDMRHQLLSYCHEVQARGAVEESDRPTPTSEDVLAPGFDSLFEQRVYNRLVERSFTVNSQVDAAGYRIDLVVSGSQRRLAVECDGDHWHGPEAYERDLARQRDLERCGWTFFRIRESEFYADPHAVMSRLLATLAEQDIRPLGGTMPAEIASDGNDQVDQNDEVKTPEDDADEWSDDESDGASLDVDEPAAEHAPTQSVADIRARMLQPYRSYDGSVPPATAATREQKVSGLVEIVRHEGPVTGERLLKAYVHASGGDRVGRLIAGELNSAIAAALRTGQLVVDDPLGSAGYKQRTFRLSDQPEVLMRELGPRTIHEVPPAELAALVRTAAENVGWELREEIYRRVLSRLDLVRLTTQVRDTLDRVVDLAQE